MKPIILGATLLGLLVPAGAWAHHAAEGIISDELWASIDSYLEGSPHLDIEFPDMMVQAVEGPDCTENLYDCMGVDIETRDDQMYLVTTVEVILLDPTYCQTFPSKCEAEFEEAFLDAVEDTNRIPSGAVGDNAPIVLFYYDPEDPVMNVNASLGGDDEFVIVELWEPIGSGWGFEGITCPESVQRGNE